MAEDNIVQKIKRGESMFKRLIGRPKTRRGVDILEDKERKHMHLEESSTE